MHVGWAPAGCGRVGRHRYLWAPYRHSVRAQIQRRTADCDCSCRSITTDTTLKGQNSIWSDASWIFVEVIGTLFRKVGHVSRATSSTKPPKAVLERGSRHAVEVPESSSQRNERSVTDSGTRRQAASGI